MRVSGSTVRNTTWSNLLIRDSPQSISDPERIQEWRGQGFLTLMYYIVAGAWLAFLLAWGSLARKAGRSNAERVWRPVAGPRGGQQQLGPASRTQKGDTGVAKHSDPLTRVFTFLSALLRRPIYARTTARA
jgi:hypothetical protein